MLNIIGNLIEIVLDKYLFFEILLMQKIPRSISVSAEWFLYIHLFNIIQNYIVSVYYKLDFQRP